MRRISIALAVVSLFAFAGTAAGAVDVTEEGTEELVLENTDCVGITVNPCTITTLFVVDAEDLRGSQVCLQILVIEPTGEFSGNLLADETGCAPIDPADFVIGDRQASATLAPTSIDLIACDYTVDPVACDASRTVTVSAAAVATPGQPRFAQAFPSMTPECRQVARVMLVFRDAIGEFSVDGIEYSATGTILAGTRTLMDVAC